MMKTLALILMLLTAAAAGAAQTADSATCPPELIAAPPSLRGLRLGMTVAEVQGALGRDTRVKVKTRGTRTFFQNFIKEPARGTLQGVRAVYLRFDEGRLYQAEFFFEETAGYAALADLTAALAAQNNFPAALWQFKNNRAALRCADFSLRADAILNPHVELTDETVRAKIVESQEK